MEDKVEKVSRKQIFGSLIHGFKNLYFILNTMENHQKVLNVGKYHDWAF